MPETALTHVYYAEFRDTLTPESVYLGVFSLTDAAIEACWLHAKDRFFKGVSLDDMLDNPSWRWKPVGDGLALDVTLGKYYRITALELDRRIEHNYDH